MQHKLELDYEKKTKVRKVHRSTTLREGGQTRLYDMHHAKHLRKTEALKEAVQRLRVTKRVKEDEPIEQSPESDLIDIINGSEGDPIIDRGRSIEVTAIDEMNEQFNTNNKREEGGAFQRLESLSPRSSNDFNARLGQAEFYLHRKISTQGDDTCIYEDDTFRADPFKIKRSHPPVTVGGSAIVTEDQENSQRLEKLDQAREKFNVLL